MAQQVTTITTLHSLLPFSVSFSVFLIVCYNTCFFLIDHEVLIILLTAKTQTDQSDQQLFGKCFWKNVETQKNDKL